MFTWIDGLGRCAETATAACLDLDKHEQGAAPRNEIDLDAIRADVARDDAIPSLFEEAGCEVFTIAARSLSIGGSRAARRRIRCFGSFRSGHVVPRCLELADNSVYVHVDRYECMDIDEVSRAFLPHLRIDWDDRKGAARSGTGPRRPG